MAKKASENNLIFRPHFKTHQNIDIAGFFRDAGVDKITVSSVEMANYFAADGWNDITIAFPFDVNEIAEMEKLSSEINLQIIINDEEHLQLLKPFKGRVGVMVEIDTGYRRTGVDFTDWKRVRDMIEVIDFRKNLEFKGILSHFGNSYKLRNRKQLEDLGRKSINRLKALADKLEKELERFVFISIGDTPTVSVTEKFESVDELRPGNFVFYDLMQIQIGSCDLKDIGAVMRCAVVSRNEHKRRLIIHGGAVHFSKEQINYEGVKTYGRVVETGNEEWKMSSSNLISLSQEHGIVECNAEDFSKYNIGDYIDIIPVHSCLTANLMKGKFVFV